MIVEFLADVGATIAGFIAGLFPVWAPPAWFSGLGAQLNQIIAPAAGLGVWVNFAVGTTVVAVVLSTWLVCFGIKLILRVGSHVPMFGGAG